MTDADDLPTAGGSGAEAQDGDDATARLLRLTLDQEAAGVQPDPRALDSIRQRVSSARSSERASASRLGPDGASAITHRAPWVFGALGAAAATIAVIIAFVVIGNSGGGSHGTPAAGPATTVGHPEPTPNNDPPCPQGSNATASAPPAPTIHAQPTKPMSSTTTVTALRGGGSTGTPGAGLVTTVGHPHPTPHHEPPCASNATASAPPVSTTHAEPTQPIPATTTTTAISGSLMHQGVFIPSAPAADQVTMYYVGPTGRLYPEPHTLSLAPKDTALAATQEWWTSRPIDSDLRPVLVGNTSMRVVGVSTFGQTTTIAIEGPRLPGPRVGVNFLYGDDRVGSAAQLHREDLLLYQALLRTAGVTGEARFTYNGRSVAESNGIRLDPLRVMTDQEARAFISIDNIVEGQIVHNPVTVSGSANLFEGNLNWDISDARGHVVKSGHTAAGSMQWKPFAIKLGKLQPGTYTIRAYESSPKDGRPTYVDDKTFTVR